MKVKIFFAWIFIFMGACAYETKTYYEYKIWECRKGTLIDTIIKYNNNLTFQGSDVRKPYFMIDTLLQNNFEYFEHNQELKTSDLLVIRTWNSSQIGDKKISKFFIDSLREVYGVHSNFEISFTPSLGIVSVFSPLYKCRLNYLVVEHLEKRDTFFFEKNALDLYPPPPPLPKK